MIRRIFHVKILSIVLLFQLLLLPCSGEDKLAQSFASPPQDSRPWVWWHWINGEISKEGIKADLEAMHEAGIGGAQVFDIGWDKSQEGKVAFMSPEWIEMFSYSVKEAERLGMEIGVNCSAGWANSGGPWNKIEDSMKKLVASRTLLQGPSKFSGALPPRGTKVGPGNEYYKDVAVFAINADELFLKAEKIESSVPSADIMKLQGENPKAVLLMPQGTASSILFDFGKKVEPKTLYLRFSQVAVYVDAELFSSDNGVDFKSIKKFNFAKRWMNPVLYNFELDGADSTVAARYFKLVMTPKLQKGIPELKETGLASLWFSNQSSVETALEKSGETLEYNYPQQLKLNKNSGPSKIIDLSSKVDASGNLEWDVPSGLWTLLRVGYCSTGRGSHPVRTSSRGLECDRFDPLAMNKHWDKMIAPLLKAVDGSKAFTNTLIDSYEVGEQNWGTEVIKHFKSMHGYDPTPWLPAVFGYAVSSKDESERFLYDWRSNISAMMAERYFGRFAELCKKDGLQSYIEPYMGPFECLPAGRRASIPMGEFWLGKQGSESSFCRVASSTAHIYGRTVVAAESFTSNDIGGDSGTAAGFAWSEAPSYMKACGDRQFCAGINKFILHSYVHQPFMDARSKPGLTLGQFGSHFGRNQTWWPFAKSWTDYLARCQFLLRQGTSNADVCAFSGENEPNKIFSDNALRELKRDGFDYDVIGTDGIFTITVKNGVLNIPSGRSYRLLSIKDSDIMSLPVLKTIERILEAGGTVRSGKPLRAPGLSAYPESEKELMEIAKRIWGENPAAKGDAKIGKGRLFWGITESEALVKLGVSRDFEVAGAEKQTTDIGWIHRSTNDAEIYFLANQPDRAVSFDALFRVSGMKPQMWNPINGEIQDIAVYSQENGLCRIPLKLPVSGSTFVIFGKDDTNKAHAVDFSFKASAPPSSSEESLVIIKAFYGSKDGTKGADVTELLKKSVKDGRLDIGVTNDALGGDPAPGISKQLSVEYSIDGQCESKNIPEYGRFAIRSEKKILAAPKDSSCVVKADANGNYSAVFSGNGKATVKLDSGKLVELECSGAEKPFTISGPWKLSFPPALGAPEKAEFETLMPLSESKIDGIKYFSGIVTYENEFSLPGSFKLEKGFHYSVSLGYPGEGAIAEIELNGVKLGTVWTAPFELNADKAINAGKNKLLVRVSAPWANRLIGDKTLPEDCKWEGRQLAAVPDWLRNGSPRPSGRIAFVGYDVFNKDSKLRKSGLQGPVEIRMFRELPVNIK